jgi:UDP-N-acetylmuramate dehydrogenase
MPISLDVKKWLENQFGERVRFDEPMSKHTSFRIGGPADALVFSETGQELVSLVKKAIEADVAWMVVGGGTNLLIKDHGIRGIVITTKNQKPFIEIEKADKEVTHIRTTAGTKLSALCRFASDNSLQGMNFALGIPGTVGGAVIMNAGTSGGAMQDVLFSIEYLDRHGSLVKAQKGKFVYSYRNFAINGESDFRSAKAPVIVEAVIQLRPGNPETIEKEAKVILGRRAETQPGGPGNAGCFFKNPSPQESAGKLIDLAGLKGCRIGGAVVSEKHANYIVNSGTATAEDVLALSQVIQEKVFQMFQIRLEPEVRIVE